MIKLGPIYQNISSFNDIQNHMLKIKNIISTDNTCVQFLVGTALPFLYSFCIVQLFITLEVHKSIL